MIKNNHDIQINAQIDVPEIRVIDSDGTSLGILKTSEALKMAEEKDSDLVLISPIANPPVAKIIDYSKFLYDLSKKKKQQRKNSKTVEVKQIKLRFCTEENDLVTKLKSATTFLKDGNKVLFSMFFKMRERTKKPEGVIMMNKVATRLDQISFKEKEPTMENQKILSMILAPSRKKSDKNKDSKTTTNIVNPLNNIVNPLNNIVNPLNNIVNPLNNIVNPLDNIDTTLKNK